MRNTLGRRELLKASALGAALHPLFGTQWTKHAFSPLLTSMDPVAQTVLSRIKTPLPQAHGSPGLGVTFVDIAKSAGITHKTIYGGETKNTYLLETTGCGVAF